MRRWVRLLFLLLTTCLFLPRMGHARQELPRVPHALPGLAGQRVHGVYVDSRNMLWIGTDNGLYRYDGLTMHHYTTGDGLEDNEVLEFWGENAGRLWLRTHTNRLCYVELATGKIWNTAHFPELKIRSPFVITSVSFGPRGEIYALSDASHVTLLDPVARQVRALPQLRLPRYLYHPPGGGPLLLQGYGDELGRWFYRLGARHWEPFPPSEHYFACEHGGILYLFSPQKSSVYRFTDDTPVLYRSMPPIMPGDQVLKFFVFAPDLMAVLTKRQLLLLDRGSVHAYDCPGLSGIACDRDRNLWLATQDRLFFVPAYYQSIGVLPADSSEQFRSMQWSDGGVILYTDNGHVIRCGKELQEPQRYRSDLPGTLLATARGHAAGWTVFLPAGKKWQVGLRRSSGTGTSNYTYAKGVFKELLAGGDTAYLRTALSLLCIYPFGDKLHTDTISSQHRNTAMYLRGGEIWFSTLDSLYCHKDGRTFSLPLPNSHVVKAISAIGPFVLVSNGDHLLHVYSPALRSYTTYALSGHPGTYLEKIVDAGPGRKFLKTNKRLYLLEINGPARLQLRGIENLEPDVRSVLDIQMQGDDVYLLTAGACYRYPYAVLTATQPAPALRPLRLRYTGGHRQQEKQVAATGEKVSLPAFVRDYVFSFSVDAVGKRQAEAMYALSREKEETPDWIPLQGNEIKVTLPGYGSTWISVRTRSISSGFGPVLRQEVYVRPPFWYDYRFIAACILAALGLFVYGTVLVFRRFARRKEEKLARDMQALQQEFRALNAMMNPHFVFNSLNSIQSFINTDDKKAANRYLLHFSRLIRQNMVNISADLIPVRQELEVLRHYLEIEQLRFEGALRYTITIDSEETNYCSIPPLLIQPLVENAILHGLTPLRDRQPELDVALAHDGQLLQITVRDNGIGFYNSRKKLEDRPSFGIDYIRRRLEKIGAMTRQECHFSIQSEPGGEGTVIHLSLPGDTV